MRERIQVARSREVTLVDVASVVAGCSPRLSVAGTNRIQQLAESVGVIPPILVQRSTMRVVDGAQRLAAARRAEELMRRRPEASLREVAREAGISVGTAFDVRRQLAAVSGEGAAETSPSAPPGQGPADPLGPALRAGLERLADDPSLRHTERGEALLRLVSATLALAEQSDAVADATPGHCRDVLRDVGQACARAWYEFTDRLGDTDLAERAA
ncbi:hypothetical protein ACIBMZ_22665 [Micromonospora sp. NPDC049900]|uniref:hypothetical protein n=1 Tax=Micromonospora sp. NPDC049900 TaxID=3364275 RepID=UPI003798BF45